MPPAWTRLGPDPICAWAGARIGGAPKEANAKEANAKEANAKEANAKEPNAGWARTPATTSHPETTWLS